MTQRWLRGSTDTRSRTPTGERSHDRPFSFTIKEISFVFILYLKIGSFIVSRNNWKYNISQIMWLATCFWCFYFVSNIFSSWVRRRHVFSLPSPLVHMYTHTHTEDRYDTIWWVAGDMSGIFRVCINYIASLYLKKQNKETIIVRFRYHSSSKWFDGEIFLCPSSQKCTVLPALHGCKV